MLRIVEFGDPCQNYSANGRKKSILFVGKFSKIGEKDVNLDFGATRGVAKNDEISNGIVSVDFRALADAHSTVLDVTIRSSETSDISFCCSH